MMVWRDDRVASQLRPPSRLRYSLSNIHRLSTTVVAYDDRQRGEELHNRELIVVERATVERRRASAW
jgi:hypothetical protein